MAMSPLEARSRPRFVPYRKVPARIQDRRGRLIRGDVVDFNCEAVRIAISPSSYLALLLRPLSGQEIRLTIGNYEDNDHRVTVCGRCIRSNWRHCVIRLLEPLGPSLCDLFDCEGGRQPPEPSAVFKGALESLDSKERYVLEQRFGLADGAVYSYEDLASNLGTSKPEIVELERRAVRRLLSAPITRQVTCYAASHRAYIDFEDPVENARELDLQLMRHLKDHAEDLEKLRRDVFEQLIAEFFASWGFDEVRLVGRNSHTGADVFAIQKTPHADTRIRYFVEIKKHKEKIGVEVVNSVYGALIAERPRHGWHIAMIVSLSGFTAIRRHSAHGLRLMGVELRDRSDVMRWLMDYKPSDRGLWLPSPMKDVYLLDEWNGQE